jgi:hypothetical protein
MHREKKERRFAAIKGGEPVDWTEVSKKGLALPMRIKRTRA